MESGTVIAGKYEIIEPAGTGGMATVWRARTRGAAGFSRPVAIKQILPHLAQNREFVAMFVEEARVVSELYHPNIVQIHDFGQDEEGNYFLVMEWIEGLDFGRYVKSFTLGGWSVPWPLVAASGIEILRALSAAHDRIDPYGRAAPVFHRDVTPHNVLIGVNGITKLTDFGLARAMDRARMTRPDIIKGKFGYLSPEMTFGSAPTPQTDLFGVGIVMWEALAGRRLFEATDAMRIIGLVRECRSQPITSLRPDVPPQLAQVVHTALSKDPSRRYASCHDMARVLANLLRSIPEPTDAVVVGRSVVQARERLAQVAPDLLRPSRPISGASDLSGSGIPLVRRKR